MFFFNQAPDPCILPISLENPFISNLLSSVQNYIIYRKIFCALV